MNRASDYRARGQCTITQASLLENPLPLPGFFIFFSTHAGAGSWASVFSRKTPDDALNMHSQFHVQDSPGAECHAPNLP